MIGSGMRVPLQPDLYLADEYVAAPGRPSPLPREDSTYVWTMILGVALFFPSHLLLPWGERLVVAVLLALAVRGLWSSGVPRLVLGVESGLWLGWAALLGVLYLIASLAASPLAPSAPAIVVAMESARYFIIGSLAAVGSIQASRWPERFHRTNLRYMSALIVVAWAMAAIAYFRVPLLWEGLEPLYAATKSKWPGVGSTTRLAAPLSNPNYLAYAAIMGGHVMLAMLQDWRLRVFVAFAVGGLVLFTGSRAGVAAAAVALPFWLASVVCSRKGLALRVAISCVALVAITFAGLAALNSGALGTNHYIPKRYVEAIEAARDEEGLSGLEEYSVRAQQVEGSWAVAWESPLWGHGSEALEGSSSIDNQFASILARTGVLGLGSSLVLAAAVTARLIGGRRDASSRALLIGFLSSTAVMLAAGAFLDNARLSVFAIAAALTVSGGIGVRERRDLSQG